MRKFTKLSLIVPVLLLVGCATQPKIEGSNEPDFTIEELKERAELASHAGAHKDALLQYQKILASDPDNIDALIGSAESLMAADQPKRAENYLERALKLDKLNPQAREARAICWLMQGDHAAAKKSLLNLQDDGIDTWRIWNSLGVIADIKGDFTAAVGHYKRALAQMPDRAMLYNNLGFSQIMAHDYPAAEASLRKALLLKPGNLRIVNNLALAIAWQGRYDEAVDLLSEVMPVAEAHNNIGYAAYLRDDFSKAKIHFLDALDLSPTFYKKAASNLDLVNRKMELEKKKAQ